MHEGPLIKLQRLCVMSKEKNEEKNEEKKPCYAIVGALGEEIEVFLRNFSITKKNIAGNFTFYESCEFSKNLVLTRSGVGKVSAAMTTQKLIDMYSPKAIFFTGVAGALNKEYALGDIVLSRDCVQYDVDASELGFAHGHIPFTSYRFFQADEALLALAMRSARALNMNVHQGRILTADIFLSHKKKLERQALLSELAGDAVEMEGAALAHVCVVNKVPFILIRALSDKADAKASQDFSNFFKQAAGRSFSLLRSMLQQIDV